MHRDGKPRSMILADGYSYTEIIPAPNGPGGSLTQGCITIFHALFCPDEADQPATADDNAAVAQLMADV